jgi:TfoX/Sxy family transcriptional regulator of competence genes
MHNSKLQYLQNLLETLLADLPNISQRRMFGCDAFFVDKVIFALIWKTGRIALKIPEANFFEKLMSIEGSLPWTAGNKTMSYWILVPEYFHDNQALLIEWTQHAYTFATAEKSHHSSSKKSKI